jgi:hypothetical protein
MPGRAKGRAIVERTRSRGCGQSPVRKGDEVHRVSRRCEVPTRVSPGALLAHTESAAAAGSRKQVRLTGRKLRQLVQIQIGVESLRGSSHCWNSQLFEARGNFFCASASRRS